MQQQITDTQTVQNSLTFCFFYSILSFPSPTCLCFQWQQRPFPRLLEVERSVGQSWGMAGRTSLLFQKQVVCYPKLAAPNRAFQERLSLAVRVPRGPYFLAVFYHPSNCSLQHTLNSPQFPKWCEFRVCWREQNCKIINLRWFCTTSLQ